MATLFQLPKAVPVVAGESLPGAKAYFYQAGTTTPITTYTTAALSVAHNHPVVADGNGVFAPIFLNEAANATYRLQLYSSADVLQYDVDNLYNLPANTAETGLYTATLTGCSTTPGVSVYYARVGNIVTLNCGGVNATSNATSCTLTGAPTSIRPAVSNAAPSTVYRFTDNGVGEYGPVSVRMTTAGVLQFERNASATGFTNTGTKGPNQFQYTYCLNNS